MDIVEIKHTVMEYQNNGKHNEAIIFMKQLLEEEETCDIVCLFLSELFWVFREKLEHEPPEVYASIPDNEVYDLLDYFQDLFQRAYIQFNEELAFLWQISLLIGIDPIPFVCTARGLPLDKAERIGKEMNRKAFCLADGAPIEPLVKCVSEFTSEEWKRQNWNPEELIFELKLLRFKKHCRPGIHLVYLEGEPGIM